MLEINNRHQDKSTLLKKMVSSREARYSIFFLIIQQAIAAFSTMSIIQLSKAITSHQPYRLWLSSFVLSLVVVYLPGIFYVIFSQKVMFNGLKHYVNLFIHANQTNISFLNSSTQRKKREPLLTNEHYLVIEEVCGTLYDWLAISLNALFNLLVIGFMINVFFFLAYALSLIVLYLTVLTTSNRLQNKTELFQEDRKELQHHLMQGWDNILINNEHCLTRWKTIYFNQWKKTKTSAVRYHVELNLTSALGMAFALLPLVVAISWFLYINANQWVMLSALAVTLPRQMQIIQNTFTFFSYAIQWSGIKSKLRGLEKGLARETEPMHHRVQLEKMVFSDRSSVFQVNSIEQLIDKIHESSGRIHIRGPNGSGKTTLLCMLKVRFQQDSIYLPCMSTLCFDSTYSKTLSTGEKTKNILLEIAALETKYIFLDEWNANLDQENRMLLDKILDQLACNARIIEVRHGSD